MLYTSCIWRGMSRVGTTSSMWVCWIYIYLVGPSRGPHILLLQVMIRSMGLRGLYPIRKKDLGLYTKSDQEGIMLRRTAVWGKKIWPMFQTSCEHIILGMGIDCFNLHLTSGACGTLRLCPEPCRPPCLRECIIPRAFFWPVGLDPMGWGMFFVACYLIDLYPH